MIDSILIAILIAYGLKRATAALGQNSGYLVKESEMHEKVIPCDVFTTMRRNRQNKFCDSR